jgi:hypothetical protein
MGKNATKKLRDLKTRLIDGRAEDICYPLFLEYIFLYMYVYSRDVPEWILNCGIWNMEFME